MTVLVLGDWGRSPRMQYHALSLANLSSQHQIQVIAYQGSKCIESVDTHPRITTHLMQQSAFSLAKRANRNIIVNLLLAAAKVIAQCIELLKLLLWTTHTPTHVLVQNPPSIPTLLVCKLACLMRGSQFVIDWHNMGYSLVGLSVGAKSPITRACELYERVFARWSDQNLCVTHAMRQKLVHQWRVDAERCTTLHDRPGEQFARTSVEECHSLFTRLQQQGVIPHDVAAFFASEDGSKASNLAHSTIMTHLVSGKPELRPASERPVLLVSSTSWTADEDFTILLRALVQFDNRSQLNRHLPRILCIITGKGELQRSFLEQYHKLALQRCRCVCAFLAADDYPLLLGCADLGVSLHYSSSALDLPMKVVDMFGSATPVCALKFSCISELVQHSRNGLVFATSEQLCDQLIQLFENWRIHSTPLLDTLRSGVDEWRRITWTQSWNNHAKPVFTAASQRQTLFRTFVASFWTRFMVSFLLLLVVPLVLNRWMGITGRKSMSQNAHSHHTQPG